jgi:hypothetical protein
MALYHVKLLREPVPDVAYEGGEHTVRLQHRDEIWVNKRRCLRIDKEQGVMVSESADRQ